jgi:hypothetical protein
MTRKVQLFVCLLALLALPSALGQQTFNNDSVIGMIKMGFSEDLSGRAQASSRSLILPSRTGDPDRSDAS